MEKMAIGYATPHGYDEAVILSQQFNFVIDNQEMPRLNVTDVGLVLLIEGFSPLQVDFTSLSLQRRHAAGKQQGLIRACKPTKGMHILDLTAGWGRDAALLASFGAEVSMLERQPIMAALLRDGLNRLASHSTIDLSLSLLHQDAKTYLQSLDKADYPDVIYIDPMHPVRQKSALVKKDMQALQHLFGSDNDVLDLLELAIRSVQKRVVVKWPQRLPPLLEPNQSIVGKTVRFDIYHPVHHPSLRSR